MGVLANESWERSPAETEVTSGAVTLRWVRCTAYERAWLYDRGTRSRRPGSGVDRAPRRASAARGNVPFSRSCSRHPVLLLSADIVVTAPIEVLLPLLLVVGIAAVPLAVLARLLHSWPRAGLIVVSPIVPFLLAGLVVDSSNLAGRTTSSCGCTWLSSSRGWLSPGSVSTLL